MSEIIEHINANDEGSPLFFLSVHAGLELPKEEIEFLGLAKEDWNDHISHDLGAAWLTKKLATHFHAQAVLSRYSRLWVDLNRHPKDPTVVRKIYDGRVINGNLSLTKQEKQQRLKNYFFPFHDYVSGLINDRESKGLPTVLCDVHSFTGRLQGGGKTGVQSPLRPWHIGILATDDDAKARALFEIIKVQTDWHIGWNEPYSGTSACTHTLFAHGIDRKIPHFGLEIRNDLLQDPINRQKICDDLCRSLQQLVQNV